MQNRPKIKPELSVLDKLMEIVGWIALAMLWALLLSDYNKLPDTIPTHFSAEGKVDAFGNKNTILILPVIATIVFVGMTVLNLFPQIFNYPVKITEENAFKQYIKATRIIRYLKFIIVVIFGFIMFKTMQIAIGKSSELGSWFTIAMLVLIFAPLLHYLIQSFLERKR